VQIWL